MGALGCRRSTGLDGSAPRMGIEVLEGQDWMSVPLGWVTGQERCKAG